jgi:hypothetical protein
MPTFNVEVDVALSRPPKHDKTIFYIIEADNGVEAELIACQIAQSRPNVVMAVGSIVTNWTD